MKFIELSTLKILTSLFLDFVAAGIRLRVCILVSDALTKELRARQREHLGSTIKTSSSDFNNESKI